MDFPYTYIIQYLIVSYGSLLYIIILNVVIIL